MRELVIDVTRLLSRGLDGRLPTGVDRVILEYVRHFGSRAKALVRYRGRWVVMNDSDSRRVFDALLVLGPDFAKVIRHCVGKGYWLSWSVRKHSVLLNLGHSGLDEPGYVAQLRRREMLPVFFLHDLIPISHPEYCRTGESEKHQRRLLTMLCEGRGLIVNSADTRDALERFAIERGVHVPPSVVASLAPATLVPSISPRPLDAPYFVMLGTIEPRKNHLMLLHVWRQLIEELGAEAPHLVIIGQRGWECEQIVDLLDRCAALKGHVVEKSNCSDAELACWLQHSQALLFPSFAEGFGMPMVEALMLGVPVLASQLSVFNAIAADIPDYLSPLDGLGWHKAILDYARPDSRARHAQCLRLQDFRAPTWSRHFEVVESLLEQVIPQASLQ